TKNEIYFKKVCTNYGQEGHLFEQCFERLGYSDWYKGKKAKKNNRLAAHVKSGFDEHFSRETPFDMGYENEVSMGQNGHVDQKLVAAFCQEMMKINFHGWSRNIKMALGAKLKLGFIDGSCVKPASDHDDLQRWIRCDYMERYGQSNGPLVNQLERELNKIYQSNLSVASYFNKLKKCWDELHNINGMPTFRSQILAMDPLPTVNKAYYIVQQIEKQKQVTNHVFEPTAFFANMNNKNNSNGSRENNKGNRNEIKGETKNEIYFKKVCTNYGQEGHLFEQCFERLGYPDCMGQNGHVDQKLVAAFCQEMMKMFIGKAISEDKGEPDNENSDSSTNLISNVNHIPPKPTRRSTRQSIRPIWLKDFVAPIGIKSGPHYLFFTSTDFPDDVLITGNTPTEIDSLKKSLDNKFTIKDLGLAKYFLGIEICHTSTGTHLNQRKYILDLLTNAGLTAAKHNLSPLPTNLKLSLDKGVPISDLTAYRRLVGRLLYLTMTRPDISYGVQHLSQFVSSPKDVHLQAVIYLLKYIKGTASKGLFYPIQPHLQVTGFTDADWTSWLMTRKSLTGYCIFLGDSLVSWKTKKQAIVRKDVMFAIGDNKSLDLDGFTSKCFKEA
nr:retrovirus-related Pol polyprotein from transposon TNT 1-94 [Tanacetum cinerariifolium]